MNSWRTHSQLVKTNSITPVFIEWNCPSLFRVQTQPINFFIVSHFNKWQMSGNISMIFYNGLIIYSLSRSALWTCSLPQKWSLTLFRVHRQLNLNWNKLEGRWSLLLNYFDLLVKCHIPKMVHSYALKFLTIRFSSIYEIISRASSRELYPVFLQEGPIGSKDLKFDVL